MPPEKPSYRKAGLSIGPVSPEDLPIFIEMMTELVDFMDAREFFTITPEEMGRALFDEPAAMEAIIVRYKDEPAGFATWFENFEALSGKKILWFDYFYVRPQYRALFIGPAMLVYLLNLARQRDYLWLEGTVQDWNAEAIGMYQALKAQEIPHKIFRLHLSRIDWSLYGHRGEPEEQ